jgi:haloalkane dehalogenase
MGEAIPPVIRTPEERFAGLPDFPYGAHDLDWEGLRLAYLDEGEPGARTVVLFHGEPTWSYLWRTVIPPLLAAGLRCVAPDLPGFGRSDKPTDLGWYSYDRHVAAMGALLNALDVGDATFVVHDWGGPIGLRLAVEQPARCARIVAMDTGLFSGRQRMTDAWLAFRDFVARADDLPVGLLVRRACHTDPGDAVVAAYEAPFTVPEAKAGARAFPLILPTEPQMPGATESERVAAALREDERAMLLLWADGDPVLPPEAGRRFAASLGRPDPEIVPHASHFLQEDAGPAIGARIAAWLDEQAETAQKHVGTGSVGSARCTTSRSSSSPPTRPTGSGPV